MLINSWGLVACGQVAIPANVRHHALSPEGIGTGLKTKINVNLGGYPGIAKTISLNWKRSNCP